MIAVGSVVAARYRLDALIGQGAMGTVFRAVDLTLGRQVAIKLLVLDGSSEPQAVVDQFLREARIAAAVQHRNVIHTIDFGTIEGQQPYMVMELLDGCSMADRMDGPLPIPADQLLHLVSLTLRGLSAVHDAGIVHRDLKPANIFLQNDAEGVFPKILDFGISRSLASNDERRSAISTQRGVIVGTPDYMAPEQARGESNITRAADIYAMGVILYEGLSGRLPFDAVNVGDLIVQIVTAPPHPLRDLVPTLPDSVFAVIEQAMAKEPRARFVDARAMRKALSSAQADLARHRADPRAPRSTDSELRPPSMLPQVAPVSPVWGGLEGLSKPLTASAHASPGGARSLPPPTPPSALVSTGASLGARRPSPQRAAPQLSMTASMAAPAHAMIDLPPPSLRPLEIDYGPSAPPHVAARKRLSDDTGAHAVQSHAGVVTTADRARARASRRPRWLVPALGIALVALWVIVPYAVVSRFPAQVDVPAKDRAYRLPSPLQIRRRENPGRYPPALRDVASD